MLTRPAALDTVFVIGLLLAWLGFTTASSRLEKLQPTATSEEMQVALPRFIQVLLAGGDRFLATNIAVFRALTVNTDNQKADRFAVQARVQSDAAWLNPYHEDNYYLAAAALSWNGQLNAAQQILASASTARSFDMLPPFFYAFNEYYFRHDPINGAEWLKIAAKHTPSEQERLSLNRLAANWMVKGQDRQQALKMLEAMAAQSRYASLRRQILQRAERVKQLIQLDEAIATYQTQHQRLPISLDELVTSKTLKGLPLDPLGQGYTLDNQGKAQVKAKKK